MPINTKIDGSPDSIWEAGQWIHDSLASSISDAVSQIYEARNNADSEWQGEASEAFQTKMTTGGRRGEEFASAAETMAEKINNVGDALRRAHRDMAGIRSEAGSAGLTVTGETIEDPGAAPPAAGPAPTGESATPEAMRLHADAVDAERAHAKKVAAYRIAEQDAERVRQQWEETAQELATTSNSVGEKAWFPVMDIAAGATVGAAAAIQGSILFKQSQAYLDDAAKAMQHVKAYGGVVLDRQGLYQQLDRTQASTRAAAAAADDAAKATSKGHITGLKVGGALAVAGVAYDIAQGKPADQAIVSGAAGFGASVGMAVGIGAVVGGPVGAGIGAVVGAGVGVFTSGMVDSLYENGIGAVGQAASDGVEALADTGEAILDGATGAADAVAGGVKDAWDAIF